MAYISNKKTGWFANISEFIFLLCIVFLIRTFGFGLYQVPTGSMETTMLVGERFFADKFSYWIRKPHRGEVIAFNDPTYVYSDNYVMRLFERYVWGPSNWTKRVIGIPNDHVRGAIEDGKPVIYINDVKLEESYLNKYPLLRVWKEDPLQLRLQLEREIAQLAQGRMIDQALINNIIEQKLCGYTSPKSYDEQVPFDKQPFYRIKPERIIRDMNGQIESIRPGTPIYPTKAVEKNKPSDSDEFDIYLGADEYWCMGDNRLGSKDCRSIGTIKENNIHGRIVFRIWSIDSDESWWIIDLIKHPLDFWSRVRWDRFFSIIK